MAVTNVAADTPKATKGFSCDRCGKWHTNADRGKSSSPGIAYCLSCTYGTNRKSRRRNPHLVCKSVQCWKVTV